VACDIIESYEICAELSAMHIRGERKNQMTILPLCLDDYVGARSICRVIAAFVRGLDLISLGFKYAEPSAHGRPSYDPAVMLMLYIYGYINRIRSSRRLEAETHRNIEVMWLMEKLTPDDKTICNFRKDIDPPSKRCTRKGRKW